MAWKRILGILVGVGSIGAGTALLLGYSAPWVPTLAGRGQFALYPFAIVVGLALLVGGFRLTNRIASGAQYLSLPSMETPPGVRVFGAEFDRELAALSAADYESQRETRQRLRTRIERVAVHTLAQTAGTQAEARSLLETGEWTDDYSAAKFFSTETGDEKQSIRERVRSFRAGELVFQQRASIAIEEIAALAAQDEQRETASPPTESEQKAGAESKPGAGAEAEADDPGVATAPVASTTTSAPRDDRGTHTQANGGGER